MLATACAIDGRGGAKRTFNAPSPSSASPGSRTDARAIDIAGEAAQVSDDRFRQAAIAVRTAGGPGSDPRPGLAARSLGVAELDGGRLNSRRSSPNGSNGLSPRRAGSQVKISRVWMFNAAIVCSDPELQADAAHDALAAGAPHQILMCVPRIALRHPGISSVARDWSAPRRGVRAER